MATDASTESRGVTRRNGERCRLCALRWCLHMYMVCMCSPLVSAHVHGVHVLSAGVCTCTWCACALRRCLRIVYAPCTCTCTWCWCLRLYAPCDCAGACAASRAHMHMHMHMESLNVLRGGSAYDMHMRACMRGLHMHGRSAYAWEVCICMGGLHIHGRSAYAWEGRGDICARARVWEGALASHTSRVDTWARPLALHTLSSHLGAAPWLSRRRRALPRLRGHAYTRPCLHAAMPTRCHAYTRPCLHAAMPTACRGCRPCVRRPPPPAASASAPPPTRRAALARRRSADAACAKSRAGSAARWCSTA